MKESDIVKAILQYLRTVPRCFCRREHGGIYGTAGIPGIIAYVNGKPTKLQEATIRRIRAFAGTAAVVRSVEDVWRILEHANIREI